MSTLLSLIKVRVNTNKVCIEISGVFFSKGWWALCMGKNGPTEERRRKPKKTGLWSA